MYIEDSRLYCFLRGAMLKQLLDQQAVADALMDSLGVPGKPAQLRKCPHPEKLAAIQEHAKHLHRATNSVFRGVELPEILVAALWRSKMARRSLSAIFHAVKSESDLAAPVVAWIKRSGLKAYNEVPMGTKRPDLAGHKPGGFFTNDRVIAVELKNNVEQLKRGLDQMTTYGQYAHAVHLACTPAMALDYLDRHASARNVRHWDSRVLEAKLKEFGFGLLLLTGETVHEVYPPRERDPARDKVLEVVEVLRGRTEL